MKKIVTKFIIIDESSIEDVAKCHIAAFNHSFSSKLGQLYVKKMLQWYIISNDRFLLGLSYENKIVGYVGAASGYGSTSAMLQYTFWIGLYSVILKPYLIFNKIIIKKYRIIWKNIIDRFFLINKNKKLGSTKNKNLNDNKSLGLVVIGVHPNFRKNGLAKLLLEKFELQAKIRDFNKAHLSVKTENKYAIKAYLKCGWKIEKTAKEDTIMTLLIK